MEIHKYLDLFYSQYKQVHREIMDRSARGQAYKDVLLHRNLQKLCSSLGLKFPGTRTDNIISRPLGTRWIQISVKHVATWLGISTHSLNTIKGTFTLVVSGFDRLNGTREGTLSEAELDVRDVLKEMLREGDSALPEHEDMGVGDEYNAAQRKAVHKSRRALMALLHHGIAPQANSS